MLLNVKKLNTWQILNKEMKTEIDSNSTPMECVIRHDSVTRSSIQAKIRLKKVLQCYVNINVLSSVYSGRSSTIVLSTISNLNPSFTSDIIKKQWKNKT